MHNKATEYTKKHTAYREQSLKNRKFYATHQKFSLICKVLLKV